MVLNGVSSHPGKYLRIATIASRDLLLTAVSRKMKVVEGSGIDILILKLELSLCLSILLYT